MLPVNGDNRPAAKLKDAFERLGGVYLAFARFLMWRADLLDAESINLLRRMNPVFSAVPRDKVAALLRLELGETGGDLARQMEEQPVWSTLSRTAYLSWHQGTMVVVQVARDPFPESALADFEAGIGYLRHPDMRRVAAPRILAEFRQWLRGGESIALERSYLEVLGRSQGETLVDYPAPIPEISTANLICWPWVEGETAGSLIGRGQTDAVTRVAVAVLEQYCNLAIIDADLQLDAIVLPTGGDRLAIRRIDRPLSVPPPAVNLGMKYIAAVQEGNASMTVQTLMALAVGQSNASLESDLMNLMSGIEPELKVHAWYPGSAAAFESNWRALDKLKVSRPRPLYLDCLQRNLIAVGYWTSDAVAAGGKPVDTIAEAQWPVVARVLRLNAGQFLNPAVLQEWSAGLGLLTFGAMREANRLAEELRENNLTVEVEEDTDLRANENKAGPGSGVAVLAACLLIALLGALRWGSGWAALALALVALAGLAGVIAKVR